MKVEYLRDLPHLKEFLLRNQKVLFTSSKTSRVLSFDSWDETYPNMIQGNLSQISPREIRLCKGGVFVCGGVTWEELDHFCLENHLGVYPGPTDKSACVLAGLATSATGERSFGTKTLRDLVLEIKFMDFRGDLHFLDSNRDLRSDFFFREKGLTRSAEKSHFDSLLESYQKNYRPFEGFKNGPFPRLQKETDLMVGFEGQLGVITECRLGLLPFIETRGIFISLSSWRESRDSLLEFFKSVQAFRGHIMSCEFLDSDALSYLDSDRPREVRENKDLIFIEVVAESFELIWKNFLLKLETFHQDNFFEMNLTKWSQLRVKIPLNLSEKISMMKLQKKGTDVQVSPENFSDLLDLYLKMTGEGIETCLFGHLGDAHLHFNLLPGYEKSMLCGQLLESFYLSLKNLSASPFAEHGIGTFKRSFIGEFYSHTEKEMFQFLKQKMDPYNIFFPLGFMSERGVVV